MITNFDLLHPGGLVDETIRHVVQQVNRAIAPAVINERCYPRDDVRALEFRGRWGTFRVSFLVSELMLDRGMANNGWLAYELEGLMNSAINSALRDLIIAELGRTEADRYRVLESDISRLAARVLHLETPWWRRLAIRLQRWLA